MNLRAWIRRVVLRRPAPQHPALRGSQWRGVWQSMPHRPLRSDDERARQAEINAANQPPRWLDRGPRERW